MSMRNIMKKYFTAMVMATVLATAGCAGKGALIETVGVASTTGIFEKLEQQAPSVPGYADLRISSSIKTHSEDAFVFNSCNHGSADYRLLLNIDGQPLQIKGKMAEERLSPVDRSDPEAGNGCRYRFEALVRLKAGRHTVTIAIPEDEVVVSKEVQLQEGANYLTVKPVYRQPGKSRKIAIPGEPGFQGGIKAVLLQLDGKAI